MQTVNEGLYHNGSALSSLKKVSITESQLYIGTSYPHHARTQQTVACLHQMASPKPQRTKQTLKRQQGLEPSVEKIPGGQLGAPRPGPYCSSQCSSKQPNQPSSVQLGLLTTNMGREI